MSSTQPVAAEDPRVVALVGRAVARDQAAFAELYDLYLGAVYRYVYYRCERPADAEDLTEQVFLHAWAAIERFRWQGCLEPFLKGTGEKRGSGSRGCCHIGLTIGMYGQPL